LKHDDCRYRQEHNTLDGQAWAVISGFGGVIVGLAGLIVAIVANRCANDANDLARGANHLSQEANQIRERPLKSSERIREDQIELQRLQVEQAHETERTQPEADIREFPGMRTSGGRLHLKVENRGPYHADDVTLSLHEGEQSMTVGAPTN
jgi:hypothetical protein